MRHLLLAGALSLVGMPTALPAEATRHQWPHGKAWVEMPAPQGDPRKAWALSPDLTRSVAADIVEGQKLPLSLVVCVRETVSGRQVAAHRDDEWPGVDVGVRWLSENRILLTGTTNRKNTTFRVLDAANGTPVAGGTGTCVVSSPDGARLLAIDLVPGGFIPAGAHACGARLVDVATGTAVVLEEWRIGSEDLGVLPSHVSWTPLGAAVTYVCGAPQSRTLTVWEVAGDKPKRRSLSLAGWPEPVSWAVSSDLRAVAMSYEDKIIVAPLEASSPGSRSVE